jgi:tetratricopeptide (TPR) repeat protein
MKSRTLRAAFVLALLTGAAWAEQAQRSPSDDLNAGVGGLEEKGQPLSEADVPQATLSDSSNSTACVDSGRELYKSKQYQEALGDFQKAISFDPTNATAYFWLGSCHYALGEYEQAADSYRQYVILKSCPAGNYWLANSLLKLHRFSDAETEYRKAVGMDSTKPAYYDGLGYCLSRLKRYAEAVSAYKRAVSLGGESAYRCEGLGSFYFHTKDYAQARDWYRKWVVLDPHKFEAYYDLGICLYRLKSYESATDAFQKAIQIKPDNWQAHSWLGDCLEKLGSYQQAADALRKAHELNKEDKEAKTKLFLLYLMTGQHKKVSELWPLGYGIGVGLLLAAFGLGTALLLKRSFKVSTVATPGLGFTVGWILIYVEGQLACAFTAGLFGLTFARGSDLVGMVAASIPLLVAAMAAFPKQTWGAPFARPRSFPWKWVGVACLVLILIYLGVAGCAKLVENITHKPFPNSHAQTFFKETLRGHPALAVLAGAILGPMAEEVLFRGLLFGALQKWLSTGWIILTTAIVFAAYHFDLPHFVPLLAIGVLLGWVRDKTGSVLVSAVIHTLINALAFAAISASPKGA